MPTAPTPEDRIAALRSADDETRAERLSLDALTLADLAEKLATAKAAVEAAEAVAEKLLSDAIHPHLKVFAAGRMSKALAGQATFSAESARRVSAALAAMQSEPGDVEA